MKKWIITILCLLILPSAVLACPACAVSKSQNDVWQTFWILSVMGILPIVVFAAVSWIIVRLQKNEKKTVAGF